MTHNIKMFQSKQATKNAWVFTWLIFTLFVGMLIVAYLWTIDLDDCTKWAIVLAFWALAIFGLLAVLYAYAAVFMVNRCTMTENTHVSVKTPVKRSSSMY